jgi:hypothetical protein
MTSEKRTHPGAAPASDPTAGSSPTDGASRRDRRRRQLAAGLIAYGVVGLLLFVVSVPVIVGPLASLGRIATQRVDAIRWLDLTGQGLDDVGLGSANAGTSLASAATAAGNAALLAQELSASMTSLRDASGLSILGSQPLAGLTDSFDRVAGRAGDLSSSMTSLAGSLGQNTRDFAAVSADAATLREQVSSLRDAFAAPGSADVESLAAWLVPAALLLVTWLATPAVASLVAGILMFRAAGRESRSRGLGHHR